MRREKIYKYRERDKRYGTRQDGEGEKERWHGGAFVWISLLQTINRENLKKKRRFNHRIQEKSQTLMK